MHGVCEERDPESREVGSGERYRHNRILLRNQLPDFLTMRGVGVKSFQELRVSGSLYRILNRAVASRTFECGHVKARFPTRSVIGSKSAVVLP